MIWRARPDDVEDDIILRCIELGLRAPSGSNGQNWEFVVIRDPAVKRRLGAQYRRVWPRYRRLGHRLAGVAEDDSLRRAQRAVQWQIDRFEEPPVLVACCLRGGARTSWPRSCGSSCGILPECERHGLLDGRRSARRWA